MLKNDNLFSERTLFEWLLYTITFPAKKLRITEYHFTLLY